MRVLATAILAGTAAAAVAPLQQPIQLPKSLSSKTKSAIKGQLHNLKYSLDGLTEEAAAIWEDIAAIYPEQMSVQQILDQPKKKKVVRRPDSDYDHVVHGKDIQDIWVTNENGHRERKVDGKLDSYKLRVKKVDPSSLGVDPGVKQYSGYLDDNENDKHLFYWFFESRNDPKNDPIVLWLNGGPGCSSMTGLFVELGPSLINKTIQPVYNINSWNSNASVIFLDQPVNVGFSYSGEDVSNTPAAGEDVYALLTLFFEQFPEYAHQDFHVAGESYGGHYVPVFVSEILSHKKRNINLKSALIGNGLTDPYTQYAYYRPMACGDGGYPAVLDEETCQSMDNSLSRCQSLINLCYSTESVFLCLPASVYCNNALVSPYQSTGQNPYDVREQCQDPENLCYTQTKWTADYLNQPHVQKAIGAESTEFASCNTQINLNFQLAGDWMKPFHRTVPGILEQIPVLIYAGDADFICNWLGNKAWTEALEWPGQEKYDAAKMEDLYLAPNTTDTKIGQVKSSGNFTFIQIHAAGHMVPLNQGPAALAFFNRWLAGEWAN